MTTFDRTVELDVEGMTCGSCVANIREEFEDLPEVGNVDVILRPEGTSQVTVVINTPIEDKKLTETVTNAGYTLVGIRRDTDNLPVVDADNTEKSGGCGCGCGCN